MIVLTTEEADKVRGRSPADQGRAIYPVPLKDGRFMLGEEVMDDPANQDVREFLASLPQEDIAKLPVYTAADARPETEEVTKLTGRLDRRDEDFVRAAEVKRG